MIQDSKNKASGEKKFHDRSVGPASQNPKIVVGFVDASLFAYSYLFKVPGATVFIPLLTRKSYSALAASSRAARSLANPPFS